MMRLALVFICIICFTCIVSSVFSQRINVDSIKLAIQQRQVLCYKNAPVFKNILGLNARSSNLRGKVGNAQTAYLKKQGLPPKPMSKHDAYTCYDTSFRKLIGLNNEWMYVNATLHTSDDGVLISGNMFDSVKSPNAWNVNGFIIKTDNNGNVQWVQQFADAQKHKFYFLYIFRIFELTNKDIIAIATMDTNSTGGYEDVTVVCRLNSKGNMLWYSPLKSALSTSSSGVSINIKTVYEGLNGDLIFAGSTLTNSSNTYETIIRMTSAGKVVWDANYGNNGDYHGGTDGINAFVAGNKIIECGLSYGDLYNSYEVAINFLTLEYATGNLISKKFIVPDYVTPQERFNKSIDNGSGKLTRLNNGHYVVYGDLYAQYLTGRDTSDYFGVTEFDANLNLVKSYTISSTKKFSLGTDFIGIQPDGKTFYCLGNYANLDDFNLFLVSEKNEQFLKSRNVHYDQMGNAGNNGFVALNDDGYAYIQSHFDKSSGSVQSFIEYNKLHNQDTASDCLGTDSLFLKHLPYKVKTADDYHDLDDNIPNQIITPNYKIAVTDTLTSYTENGCLQKNNCDTVSIHGKTDFCSENNTVLFTAYKNRNCGEITQWSIDTSIVASLQQLDDTTVAIKFKNVNWNGKLYAMLPAAKCFTDTPTDSLQLHIVQVNRQLNLGNDTTLCGINVSLTLHAGAGFKTYLWQDGSTDSLLAVNKAGKYFVTVTDYCDNALSDTINISQANDLFSIGNDISKCNSDTIVLQATPGFTNYNWQSQYKLINISNNVVKVYPDTDTLYYASAQKAGCTFYDTMHIRVLHSPAINLGDDTSICYGTVLRLNAGSDFKSYLWNTGATIQMIYAGNAGYYNVKATAFNGCSSSDTLLITAVKPLPVFSLGVDTGICKNESITYKFNLGNAIYYWSTGNTDNTQTVTTSGTYWLKITQNLCSASDTVIVYQKPSPKANLGNDTVLCEGDTKLLDAYYTNATYRWQDGSNNSQYLVPKPGLYYVQLNLDACIANDSIQINYNVKPFFNLGNDTMICNGTQITLQPFVNTAVNYYWQNGSTLPYFNITQPGIYYLIASNNCGLYTDSIKASQGVCGIILPSAFTPNHDGLNDVFKIKYPPPVKSYSLVIYNRWGQQVFASRNINEGWDGIYKGYAVSQDTFVWTLSVVDINNKKTNLKGTVTVVK